MSDSATKSDLLGAEDKQPTGGLSNLPNLFAATGLKTHSATRSRATVFSLGQRQSLLLDDLMAPLIVPHVAQENNETVILIVTNAIPKSFNALLTIFTTNSYSP